MHPVFGVGDTKNAQDSLQAVKNHQYVDVLGEPGACDLTTHVDFGFMREVFKRSNCMLFIPVMPYSAYVGTCRCTVA